MRPLKICLVSSECTPLAKTGGLADVVAALGRYLAKRGHDVRVVLPMYLRIKNGGHDFFPVPEVQDVPIRLGGRIYWFSASTLQLPRSAAKIWLVRCPELYEREGIYTQDADEHLRFALLSRAESVRGIVNGVDYDDWNPTNDVLIPHAYSGKDLAGKAKCKEALLKRFKLPLDSKVPVFGIVSRLTYQKGFELLAEILTVLLHRENIRLVVLGTGEEKYENYFTWLQTTFPTKVGYDRGYKEDLAHQIEAGADLFLMPSRYEPCGLNQMYSLKYGTVPIVRRTGGLADTVEQWNADAKTGTGFLFGEFSAEALMNTIRYALECWKDQAAWKVLQKNGMERDFSWDHQAEEYIDLYRKLVPPEQRNLPVVARPEVAPAQTAAPQPAAPRTILAAQPKLSASPQQPGSAKQPEAQAHMPANKKTQRKK